MRCPCCGCEFEEVICDVAGCDNPAEYEGWWRAKDFTGNATGLIRLVQVCEEHRTLLIGAEDERIS